MSDTDLESKVRAQKKNNRDTKASTDKSCFEIFYEFIKVVVDLSASGKTSQTDLLHFT